MFKGILVSVLASVLFGALYYLSPFLVPLDGEQIFGWRVMLTLPFTTALLFWRQEVAAVKALLLRARREPVFTALLLASAAVLGVQLWIFLWAPMNGQALPVSLSLSSLLLWVLKTSFSATARVLSTRAEKVLMPKNRKWLKSLTRKCAKAHSLTFSRVLTFS